MDKTEYFTITLVSVEEAKESDDAIDEEAKKKEEGILSTDWLTLSQKPYKEPPDGGFEEYLTTNNKTVTIETLNEYWAAYKSLCTEDGKLKTEIEVRKSRPALQYSIKATYGTLSPKFEATTDTSTSESVKKESSLDLKNNVTGKVKATWEGPVFDSDNNILSPPPEITNSGAKLSWGQKVTATLRISYSESHDSYTLTIEPRDDYKKSDRKTAYQSTVYATWGVGEVEQLEVSMPDMSGNCSDVKTTVKNDDDKKYDGDCYDLYIKYNRCTGEEISRELKSVPCPEAVKAECEKKCNEGPAEDRENCLKNCQ